jgi:uncharacterized protein (DUF1800 family)
VPTLDDVSHLMRRAGFGATYAAAQSLTGTPLDQIVDSLLDPVVNPADDRPAFMTDPNNGDWEREYMLQQWWLDRMASAAKPLQEKLTLFWHGHFCSSNEKVADMNLMFDQNSLFRHAAMGNFRDGLTQPMALQPAMLLYLDGAYNVAGTANENFARELMELFTLGVNQYTQADIMASARAWTGFNVLDDDRTTYNFYADRHDPGPETFMGVSQSWTGPTIIDFLLNGDAMHKTIAAKFITKKLWTFFAYPNPVQQIVDELAQVFLDNDLELTPLLRALFLRPEFYTSTATQGLVRSPVEYVVATLQHTGLTAEITHPEWYMDDMGQVLFEPPNVAGWKNNAYWLSSSAMWSRADWAMNVLWQIYDWNSNNTGPNIIQNAANAILTGSSNNQRFLDCADYVLQQFGVFSASDNTRRTLAAAAGQQYNARNGWRERAWMNVVVLTMLSPEFNLA